MTKVFIGGSRTIGRLNEDIRLRLDRIIEKSLPIAIGDANGADRAVQQYLCDKRYGEVEVFCAGKKPRNNIGGWPLRQVGVDGSPRGFDFYAAKDRVMAEEASVGLMIWDGKSLGTVMNALRLIKQGKKVAMYVGAFGHFVDLEGVSDWDEFVANHAIDLKPRLEHQARIEERNSATRAEHRLI